MKKVAFLTAGGLAPCLSSSIGFLIDEYTKKAPNVEMIGYVNGRYGGWAGAAEWWYSHGWY